MTEEFNKEMSLANEYVQRGQVLIGAEKFLESIAYFDKALNEDPMNQTAYISKGIAKASLDQIDDAKECFSRAIMIIFSIAFPIGVDVSNFSFTDTNSILFFQFYQ